MKQKFIVELDSRLERWINSPVYPVFAGLSGVSITFAPLFLYWWGNRFGTWLVVVNFALIYLVPLFFMRLGNAVANSIREQRR